MAASDGSRSGDARFVRPRRAVLTYVQRSCNVLTELYGQRRSHLQDELTEVLARTIKLLNEVKHDFESAARPDTRKLEASLTGIERMLDDAMRAATCDQEMENARRQIDEQLKPYKRHMDKTAYKQTWDNLLRKKLREHFGVPRLSLFFIHS